MWILAKIIYNQAAAFYYAIKSTDRDYFFTMHRNDDLVAVGVPPFLVAATLGDQQKAVFSQHADDIFGITDWKAFAQGNATSSILPFSGRSIGVGSNHSAKASLAFATASSSVSPAVAQPGNSGKKAAHRLVSESCSRTSRNFIKQC